MAVSSRRLRRCCAKIYAHVYIATGRAKAGGDIQFERLPNPKHFAWATSSDVVSGDTPLVHVLGQENKTDFIPTSLANTDN